MTKTKRIIALLLSILMLSALCLCSLVSCSVDSGDSATNNDEKPGEGGGNNNGGGNEQGGNNNGGGNNTGGGNSETGVDYTVTVKTEGGMPMGNLPVHVYTYKDGKEGSMVDFGSTDENGVCKLKINGDVTGYAVRIADNLPSGYITEAFYPLVGTKLDIEISSELIDASFAGKTLKLGDIMYDFTVINSKGESVKLSDELRENEMVVLNFWYVNCSACQLEFPFMKTVFEEEAYNDKVSIIALNPFDDNLSIRTYAQEMGFTFEVAADTQGIYNLFGVSNYPTSVVIDRYGMVSLIEVGALPSNRAFRVMFDHFTGDDYVQSKVNSLEEITPIEKPDVEMPSSDELGAAFDGGNIDVEYYMDPKEEFAWPFVIGEKDGETCIYATNSEKEATFAQLFAKVNLKKGDVVAFDYFSSTEYGADTLYILVDSKDIYRISGISKEWKTCYSFVALEDGEYEIAFCYIKDSDIDEGEDNVYLKNLRVVTEDDIDTPTFIYRFASTNPDKFGVYSDYCETFLGEDGYYHVGSAEGPILLADLMGRTHFSEKYDVYTLSIGKTYEAELVKYCNYASNSQLSGLCPVTEELKNLLDKLAYEEASKYDENSWLLFCCYYDAYGTDGAQLADPIKGLAYFSAYDTILNEEGDTDFPNVITYDRVIMPRGLFYAFTPEKSGVYQVTSKSDYEVNAWIFRESDLLERNEWLVYDKVDRMNTDKVNCYMIAYLEEGVTYYIDIAFYDVYQFGDINFRVDYLGEEGYFRFSLASPGYFTYYENTTSDIPNMIIAGGIDVVLGEDGIWREKRDDERDGSILYADFSKPTPIFNKTLLEMIELGAFDFSVNEDDLYVKSLMEGSEAYKFYLDLYLRDLWGEEYEAKYEEYKVSEVLEGKYHGELVGKTPSKSEKDEEILNMLASIPGNTDYNNDENFVEFLKDYWGEYFAEYYESYQVADVLEGIYHGKGEDKTDEIKKLLSNLIDNGDGEGSELNGCMVVTEELSAILQLLMDKFTFAGVENSWTKLCYYHEYFGPVASVE